MTTLANTVANSAGTILAGFLCSSDAHEFAVSQTQYNDRPFTVTNYAGLVVTHQYNVAPKVTFIPQWLSAESVEAVLANLRQWYPTIVIDPYLLPIAA